VTDARKPYPLSWEEQTRLFKELPDHLARMALYKVNTGCREQEVCSLQWGWEGEVPELETSVFIIPETLVKNGEERLVVLNRTAMSIVNDVRGKHRKYVFTYNGKRIRKMNTAAWRKGRLRAGLPQVRVHDLKHTFGRRLRAAGVSFEDRQDLLGHRSGRITTHYSAAEFGKLLSAANRLVGENSRKTPALFILKKKGAPLGPLFHLARPERFELPTARFVAEYSIQLSYGRVVWSAIFCWRRERDSNPRRGISPYSLSRGALSTTQPSLRYCLW